MKTENKGQMLDLISDGMKILNDVSTTFTRGCSDTNWGSLQFSSSPPRVEKGIGESVFSGQPFILSWGKVSNPPPPPSQHSSGLKEAPRTEVPRNWHRLPWSCQGQPLCTRRCWGKHCFVFRSYLTSWFGKGGWRIINQLRDAILHCMSTA